MLQCASRGARCDYALFVGASLDNHRQLAELGPRAAALKMYLNDTFSDLRLDDLTVWSQHMEHWPVSATERGRRQTDVRVWERWDSRGVKECGSYKVYESLCF